jgi:hypothetical protein
MVLSRIDDVMVSVPTLSAKDFGLEPRSHKSKDYLICGRGAVSDNDAALKRSSKDWLSRNQDNVSECSDMISADCCCSELALSKSN